MTSFSETFDTATPLGTDAPSVLDDRDRETKAAVQERANVDHYWPLTGTQVSDADSGEHRKVLFHAPITSPATVDANHGILFIKDVAGKAELFWMDEDENEIQLTSAGALNSSGNLIVAGTLDVTGNIDPTTYETTNGGFLDEDDMTSDAADKVASQQSTKAYVDAYIKLVDSKASNTDGGTFTNGAWRKRTVTEESDVGAHVAVSSSVIVLDAGTYQCRISCPGFKVSEHQARLRNTTAGSTILVGTSEVSASGDNITTRSVITGIFTIAASQNLEIQHQGTATKSTDGFGAANGFGEVEIYTIAEFWKR